VRDQTLGGFFDELASDAPAPGGGAAVGMSIGLGAALVAMVCRLTLGKKGFEGETATVETALGQADALRHRGLVLAEQDALAFGEVSAAYRLPRASETETTVRSEAIQSSLLAAATVPIDAAAAARDLAALAGSLVGRSNPRVVSDLGVAAACARSAIVSASLNVHVNTALLADRAVAADLDRRVDALVGETVGVADAVVQRVESMVVAP
jgi:formiminotetrahydrofolate cyclodeaminase